MQMGHSDFGWQMTMERLPRAVAGNAFKTRRAPRGLQRPDPPVPGEGREGERKKETKTDRKRDRERERERARERERDGCIHL